MKRTMTDVMMLIGGGVIGAGLGLLFAPYSGVKSRKKVARMSRKMNDQRDRFMRGMSDRVSDFADTMGTMSGKASKMMHFR